MPAWKLLLRVRSICLLAGCIIFASCFSYGQQVIYEELYKQAVTLGAEGNIPSAIAKYEEVLKLNADFVPALSNLGVLLASQGRYDEAIANYRIALRRDSSNVPVRLNLAIALYKEFELEKAITELTKVRTADPASRQALYLLADCYLRLGNNREAIALLEPIFTAEPNDQAIAYILGSAFIRDGQILKGQKVVERILAQGDTAEANFLMGAAALGGRDFTQAISSIRRAIEINPNLPGLFSLYGQAQLKIEDHDGARQSFLKALRAEPNDFDANLDLGILSRNNRELNIALALLTKAVQLRPSSVTAHFQLGAVLADLGKLAEAQLELEGVARQAPELQEVHVQLASLYYRLHRKEDGERERQIVLRLDDKERERNSKQARP